MKKIMLSVFALVVGLSAIARPSHPTVKKVAEGMDIVYLKISCPLIGGSIEVYNSSGELMHSEKVTRHKVIVDFYAEPSGEYTISVKKDGVTEELHYSKTTASHAERASLNYIAITQG